MIYIGNNIYVKKERICGVFEAKKSRQWERIHKSFLGAISYYNPKARSIILLTDGSLWISSVSPLTMKARCKEAGLSYIPLTKFNIIITDHIQQFVSADEKKIFSYLRNKFNGYILKGVKPSTLILMPEFCVMVPHSVKKVRKMISDSRLSKGASGSEVC